MEITLESVEEAAKSLTVPERAKLAHALLRDLDDVSEQDVDEGLSEDVKDLWLAEAERRYDAYLRGEMKASTGDEVMERLRARLSK